MDTTCPMKIIYNYLRMPLKEKHMAYACLLVCFKVILCLIENKDHYR